MPIEKAKPAAPKTEVKAEPESEPAVSQVNPFAASVPFPESQIDSSYERMEEVSLEQLLAEGRERPATMSGNVPLPDLTVDLDDVEELAAEEMMPVEETPVAVAVTDEPEPGDDRSANLEQQVQLLESALESTRAGHRGEIEEILRDLDALSARLRRIIDR